MKTGEFGTVVRANGDTYQHQVRTESGRDITCGRSVNSPGEIAILPVGTQVLISYQYGPPIITGVYTLPTSLNLGTQTFDASEVDPSAIEYSRTSLYEFGNYRNRNEPDNLIPGDRVLSTREGNLIGVLSGGVNVIKSSELAQIRTIGLNDTVEVLSRNYRHITDMGEYSIINEGGAVNMKFRGGSDQLAESGADEERWTIKFDLGSEGDILDLELCTPAGATLFNLHVDAEGHGDLYCVNGIDISSGSQSGRGHSETHTGSSTVSIGGSQQVTIGNGSSTTMSGDWEVTSSGAVVISSGVDAGITALRDMNLASGRSMNIAASGSLTETVDALSIDIERGRLFADLNLDSEVLVQTLRGGIELRSQAGGNIDLTTAAGTTAINARKVTVAGSGPNSVILGGTSGSKHAVTYEDLAMVVRQLLRLLDSHTHPYVDSGSAAITSPVAVPFSGPIEGNLSRMRSASVIIAS